MHVQQPVICGAGVFVGCMYQEYMDVQVAAAGKVAPQAVVGSGLSFMVGRLSYTFDFSGPCVSTDTACSSSLVATHLAYKVGAAIPPASIQYLAGPRFQAI